MAVWHKTTLSLLFLGLFASGANCAEPTDTPYSSNRTFVLEHENKIDLLAHPKFQAYEILRYTQKHGCREEYTNYMISTLDKDAWGVKTGTEAAELLFSMPPLVRYVYSFNQCINPDQEAKLKLLLGRQIAIFDHGTINHASMRASSIYLLAQYYPDVRWVPRGRTYTSAEVMSVIKSNLISRGQTFFRHGNYEQFSPTYSIINFMSYLNLFDFARDEQVREYSNVYLNCSLVLLRVNSFGNIILAPMTRVNSQQTAGNPDGSSGYLSAQLMLWFYYGGLDRLETAVRGIYEPAYTVILALSPWRPLASVSELKPGDFTPYSITTTTPSFSLWGQRAPIEIYGQGYVEKNYAIGTGNFSFDPADYNYSTQLFTILYKTNDPRNNVDCYHPYWRSNLGLDAWQTDRSSPFQQVYLHKERGVLLFDIPQRDPWRYDISNRFFAERNSRSNDLYRLVQCRIPKAADEIVLDKNYVFVRKGTVFIALRTLYGVNERVANAQPLYVVVRIMQPKTAIYFEIEEGKGAGDFLRFQTRIRNMSIEFADDPVSATFEDPERGTTKVSFDLNVVPGDSRVRSIPKVYYGGRLQDLTPDSVVRTPFMELGDGKFSMQGTSGDVSVELRADHFIINRY